MENMFAKFMKLKEESEGTPTGVTSRIKLEKKQGSREFTPFIIDKSNHTNLSKVVKAFLNSDQVTLPYTTIDKKEGEIQPQLKKKSLYLTGGAVRDHLMGKTPSNYDLVTDATPSEIRMILAQNGFKEVTPEQDMHSRSLPHVGKKSKVFYASKWDKKKKEMTITAVVNGQSFDISTLSKSPKSKNFTPDEAKAAANIEEDAANRDFTINALYIPLTKDDGPNSELIDPFGGAHHLKSGEIKSIGEKFHDRLKEDPVTAFRYANHFNRFGFGEEIPDKYKNSIAATKAQSSMPVDLARNEFIKGLEHPDVDPRKYLKTVSDLGLLNVIFPNIQFDQNDLPEDLRGDRWMTAAWILRKNNPQDVREMLMAGGWPRQEANDVSYLIKMYQWSGNKFDPEQFYDMIQMHSGLTKSKIRDFMKMAKAETPEVDSFLNYEGDDLTPYQQDDLGRRKVNPVYVQFMGRTPVCGEFEQIKRHLMTNRWSDMMNKIHPTM
jgi:tRNA nucleotidyltransferase/poly(A) polymerase